MAKRFPLPTISRRHVSLWLSLLVLGLGAAYVVYYSGTCCREWESAFRPADEAFRRECMQSARRANGGNGDLVMDDATEEKIGAYCGCMAEAIGSNVAPAEIEMIGRGQPSDKTVQLLSRIAEGCKPQLE